MITNKDVFVKSVNEMFCKENKNTEPSLQKSAIAFKCKTKHFATLGQSYCLQLAKVYDWQKIWKQSYQYERRGQRCGVQNLSC